MSKRIRNRYPISLKEFVHFRAWCDQLGTTPFSASPELMAAYLSECAAGEVYSPATIARLAIIMVRAAKRFQFEVTPAQAHMLECVVLGVERAMKSHSEATADDKDSVILDDWEMHWLAALTGA